MENLKQGPFMINDWQVNPSEGLLVRAGETERLEPRVMEVLVYLASRRGEVVSREELEREVWQGVIVGYDAVTATVLKLRKALQDDARHSRIIKTVPKKGYQLVAAVSPVEDQQPDVEKTQIITSTGQSGVTNRVGRMSPMHLLSGILGVIVIVIVLLWIQSTGLEQSAGAAIIVIPFDNLDDSERYDTFVDGITEDLITDLSRIANLKVFASATSFKYKGQPVTPQMMRDELGADFVLMGNARRVGNNIRFNIQLINAKEGLNVWAQRYDSKVAEVFSVQDEITDNVIDALAIRLSSSEKQHLAQRATNNLEAYEYFLEGQRISRGQTRESNARAREAYRKAIELDPTYGRAYGALAYTLALDYRHGWTDTPLQNLDRSLELAQKGVSFDDSIPQTYWSLGYVYLRRKEYEKALEAAAESIKVSPSYADGYGLLALICNGLGQPRKALEYAKRGMKLNPYYTWDYLFNAGFAYYMLGNYDRAAEYLEKAQARNENAVPVKLALVATYIKTGRREDAEWTVEQIIMLNPASTISHLDTTFFLSDPMKKKAFFQVLREAGLPE